MKKFLILLMVLAGTVGAVDFPVKYGPNAAELDSFYIITEFGGTEDTGDTWLSITSLDTTLSLTGEGLYSITLHYFYNGYSKWSDETIYYNTLLAASGGEDVDTIFTYDTSGSNTLVSGVKVTIRDLVGSIVHQEYSKNGYITYATKATDTFAVSGAKTEYVWHDDTMIVTTDQRDTLFGYDVAFNTATDTNTCVVTVQVVGQNGSAAENVLVSCVMMTASAADSAGYAVRPDRKKERTDASGNATFTRIWSSYLIPATDYRVTVEMPNGGTMRKTITVPRSTSYVVDFP